MLGAIINAWTPLNDADHPEGWALPDVLDDSEPVHVHVERDDNIAKFWLEPVRLHNSGGFSSVELRRIQSIVNDHRNQLIEAWHEYFRK